MWRLSKKLVALLVAAIVVGGLALVGSSIGSTAATPGPSAAAPDQAAKAAWQAFQAHLGSSLPVLETDINTVSNGGTAGYITAASAGVDAARADAANEVAWLQANPAAPCYSAVYGDYLSANQTLETAMADAISGDYTTANALIGQLNTSLSKLATDSPKTAC